jgi:precorrin-2 dehydrogenase/sirohydrochlorin ferrochelatase
LAFAATGVATVDQEVLAAARARGVLVTLAAAPAAGDFTLPASLHRGNLTIAVATAGQAPALAAVLRDRIAAGIGPEWGVLLEIAAALRREKLTAQADSVYSSKVLVALLDGGLADMLAHRDEQAINHLLTLVCGRDVTLAGLGLTLPDPCP